MVDKFQPCNGTHGDCFRSAWCDQCVKHPHDMDAKGQCFILLSTMAWNIDDPEYPEEWQYKDGEPVCTAFKSRDEYNARRRQSRPQTRTRADSNTDDMFD